MANVVIGTIADEKVDTEYVSSLLWLLNHGVRDIKNRVILVRGYIGKLDRGRQSIADVFMNKTDGEVLLSLDSDMVFTPEQYIHLLEGVENTNYEAVVSGIYPREDGRLTAMKEGEDGLAEVNGNIIANSPGRWFEVDAVGMGFCAIPRKVFEQLEPPYYDQALVNTFGQGLADDTSFCFQVRQAGIPIWVDKKVQVGHLKQVRVGTNIPETPLEVPEEGLIIP